MKEILDRGAQVVAISPELPKNSKHLKEKLNLDYELLSDAENKVAKSFGIAFSLNEELIEVYKGFGIDLKESNGSKNSELPIPGTYVINSEGIVIFSYLDLDYTKRMEPKEILDILENKKIIDKSKV